MNDESYEEYIRSILGYQKSNTSYDNSFCNNESNCKFEGRNTIKLELEEFYPEIYKIIYPMIEKGCNKIKSPITRDSIESITDEIFYAIEAESKKDFSENRNIQTKSMENKDFESRNNEIRYNSYKRGEDRQYLNRNLRDLIKILLIRELIGRNNRPGWIPPVGPPIPPPRPPFPGNNNPPSRPPFIGNERPNTGNAQRPPIRTREYSDIYENFKE